MHALVCGCLCACADMPYIRMIVNIGSIDVIKWFPRRLVFIDGEIDKQPFLLSMVSRTSMNAS